MDTNTHNKIPHQSRFVKVSLIVAIVIVMNLLFNYGVSLVYNEPSYDQFTPSSQVVQNITTQDACVAVGGQWTDYAPTPDPTDLTAPKGYCDPNYTNEQKFQDAQKIYDRNVFITLVILGIGSIIAGAFVTISLLSAAFSWGGVLSLLIASVRYWGSADKLFKVIILACALGTLIWLAVKKFGTK